MLFPKNYRMIYNINKFLLIRSKKIITRITRKKIQRNNIYKKFQKNQKKTLLMKIFIKPLKTQKKIQKIINYKKLQKNQKINNFMNNNNKRKLKSLFKKVRIIIYDRKKKFNYI